MNTSEVATLAVVAGPSICALMDLENQAKNGELSGLVPIDLRVKTPTGGIRPVKVRPSVIERSMVSDGQFYIRGWVVDDLDGHPYFFHLTMDTVHNNGEIHLTPES